MKNIKLYLIYLKAILILTFFNSCGSKKDVIYFQDVNTFETLVNNNVPTPKFKVDDLVSIHISTLDMESSLPFNLFLGGSALSGNRPEQIDYLIDKEGEIDFPVIGKIKISDLSAQELRVLLREKLSPYLKDPIINIRITNFTITVLGEVNRPGTYQVANGEEITILEALGLSWDMTIKGMRKNVLVIRDFNGMKVYNRIDLTSKKAMDSPVYYLTQNDVIYVEPNQSAITSSQLDNRAQIGISIFSILITSALILLTRN
jgi:polysaccharide export outer membrane protein